MKEKPNQNLKYLLDRADRILGLISIVNFFQLLAILIWKNDSPNIAIIAIALTLLSWVILAFIGNSIFKIWNERHDEITSAEYKEVLSHIEISNLTSSDVKEIAANEGAITNYEFFVLKSLAEESENHFKELDSAKAEKLRVEYLKQSIFKSEEKNS